MKKLFFFAIIGLISFNAYSQEVAPKEVLESFQSKFSNAEDVKWEMEEQNKWEAEFKLNGENISACFSTSGKWLKTEKEIKKKDLPANVSESLSLHFEDFEIEEVEIIETIDFKGYEIELEKQDTEIEVLVSNSGEIITKNIIEDEENDEDDDDDDDGDNDDDDDDDDKD